MTNGNRSKRAMHVLRTYGGLVGDPNADHETWLIDLLADLLHLEKARKGYSGFNKRAINFDRALNMARQHFAEETK